MGRLPFQLPLVEIDRSEEALEAALEAMKKIRDRKERHRLQCEIALNQFDEWMERVGAGAAAGKA